MLPNDPIVQLIPPSFNQIPQSLYQEMGSPLVLYKTLWVVYCQLLFKFCQRSNNPNLHHVFIDHHVALDNLSHPTQEPIIPLDPNKLEFEMPNVWGPRGFKYIGGKNQPPTAALQNIKDWEIEVAGEESNVEEAKAAEFIDSEDEAYDCDDGKQQCV